MRLARSLFGVISIALGTILWGELCSAAETYRIKAVNVRMLLQYSGELSPVLDNKNVLWNLMADHSELSEPASGAFVVVAVSGSSSTSGVNQVVNLVVKSAQTDKVLARYTARLGLFSSQGESHVGFWLPSVGCEPLTLSASIAKSSKMISLPFKCGE
jgi:hypothetical protein